MDGKQRAILKDKILKELYDANKEREGKSIIHSSIKAHTDKHLVLVLAREIEELGHIIITKMNVPNKELFNLKIDSSGITFINNGESYLSEFESDSKDKANDTSNTIWTKRRIWMITSMAVITFILKILNDYFVIQEKDKTIQKQSDRIEMLKAKCDSLSNP